MKNSASPKKHSMALDFVETGDSKTKEEMLLSRKSNDLPGGITSGMLYKDVIRIAWPAFIEMSLTQLAAMVNMMMVAFILPFQSSQFILAGALRGAGDTRATAIITIITVLILRPTIVIIAIQVFDMGLWGAWIAIAIDQVVRSGLVAIRFYSGKWKAAVRT